MIVKLGNHFLEQMHRGFCLRFGSLVGTGLGEQLVLLTESGLCFVNKNENPPDFIVTPVLSQVDRLNRKLLFANQGKNSGAPRGWSFPWP